MQKKCSLFIVAVVCVYINNIKCDIPPVVEGIDRSYDTFDFLAPNLRDKIPAQLRHEAEKKYREEEDKATQKEIEEYYNDILLEELEKTGSIERKLMEKIAANDAQYIATKKQICGCGDRSQGGGWFSSVPAIETEAIKADKIAENTRLWSNNQYRRAAHVLKKRDEVIQAQVKSAVKQYKEKVKLLSEIIQSLDKCGLNCDCNEDNGIFEAHLTQKYRNNLSTKIISDVVKVCKDQQAANEEEIHKIWERSSKLKPCLQDIADKNARIDYLINPDNQQEIEEKKKEKAAQDLEEQSKKEEQQRIEQLRRNRDNR